MTLHVRHREIRRPGCSAAELDSFGPGRLHRLQRHRKDRRPRVSPVRTDKGPCLAVRPGSCPSPLSIGVPPIPTQRHLPRLRESYEAGPSAGRLESATPVASLHCVPAATCTLTPICVPPFGSPVHYRTSATACTERPLDTWRLRPFCHLAALIMSPGLYPVFSPLAGTVLLTQIPSPLLKTNEEPPVH